MADPLGTVRGPGDEVPISPLSSLWRARRSRLKLIPWIVLILGGLAGIVVARGAYVLDQDVDRVRFAGAAADLRADVEARIRSETAAVRAVAAVIAASDVVTDAEISTFAHVAGVDEADSGVAALLVVDVPPEGASRATVRLRHAHPRAAERAASFDLRREAEALGAVDRAVAAGAVEMPLLAAPIGSRAASFAIVVPVHDAADSAPDAAARSRTCVIGLVDASSVLEAIFQPGVHTGLACTLRDSRGRVLDGVPEPGTLPPEGPFRADFKCGDPDDPWVLSVVAAPGSDHAARHASPWIALAAGLVVGIGGWWTTRHLIVARIHAEMARAAERAAADSVRSSEERFRLVASVMSDAFWDFDPVGDRLRWSEGLRRVFGHEPPPDGSATQWWLDHIHPDDRDRVRRERRPAGEDAREVVESRYRFRRIDGSWADVLDRSIVIRGSDGGPVRVIGAVIDRTAEQRAEDAAVQNLEYYRVLFEASPEAMWLYDESTLRFVAVNDAAVRRYGWSRDEFLRMSVSDMRPEADRERFREHLAAGLPESASGQWRHVRKDGTELDVVVSSRRLRMGSRVLRAVVLQDVTERLRLEEQFRQAQKMEAVGLLAGGVAHDFNNLLFVVIGYGDLLLRAVPESSPARGQIREIMDAAERAAELTKKLLAFSRRQDMHIVPLDANHVLRSLGKILRRLVPESIAVRQELETPLPNVLADASQLEQVVLNIVVNARDAITGRGTITLATRSCGAADLPKRLVTPPPRGDRFVVLSVTDTGCGMDEATASRIFEPFFTTKDVGHGTGLGLSTVYGIVQQGSGAIALETAPGRGTTFHIVLQATDRVAEDTGEIGTEEPSAPGACRVILAEDHDGVRDLVYALLQRAGHRVLAASSGEQALAIARTEAEPPDVLVSDVVMPGVDGPALAQQMRQLFPGIGIVYLTGYADETIRARFTIEPGAVVLRKPIDSRALLAAIRPRQVPAPDGTVSA